MGCVLGYGALHRLPPPLSEPVAGPGETLFETEHARFSNEEVRPTSGAGEASKQFIPAGTLEPSDFLVPAQLMSAPPSTSAPGRKKKPAHSPNKFMDDYFTEGEKKSREIDHAPSAKSPPPPPPPKAGGPPKASRPPEASPAGDEKADAYDSGVD